MNRLLKHPATNAICLSIFSCFYAALFFIFSRTDGAFQDVLYYGDLEAATPFMAGWSNFLAAGKLNYVAGGLLALTAAVVIMLIVRRRPYDEYQMSILRNCLAVALTLTLIAIAIFYMIVMAYPAGIIEKFTLFITIHWVAVVVADIAYILLCGRGR